MGTVGGNAGTGSNISYPSLFLESDRASLRAQNAYLRLSKAQMSLMVLSSVFGMLAGIYPVYQRVLSDAAAISVAVGLALMWIIRVAQYERAWFDCRALAESVKTAAWRYMMGAGPYDYDLDTAAVDDRFVKDLREFRASRTGVEAHLVDMGYQPGLITDEMRRIRGLPFSTRKHLYLEGRLRDQMSWYQRRAHWNRLRAATWFWIVVLVHVLALITLVTQPFGTTRRIGSVSVLMTLAAAITAWNQLKRHDELTHTYSLAAKDLEEIEAMAPHINSAQDLQTFVEQAECAISREHTMWRARRSLRL